MAAFTASGHLNQLRKPLRSDLKDKFVLWSEVIQGHGREKLLFGGRMDPLFTLVHSRH